MSEGEETLALHLRVHEIPFEREFRFHPERRYRADFFIEPDLLVEVEGGIWNGGKHGRGSGIVKDIERQNAAVLLGYRPLRFTTDMVLEGLAIEAIQRALSKPDA